MANPNGVLVVDDEPAIARVTFRALAKAGFQPIVEENGAAGLKAFLAESNAIDLVLADVVMPVMDGITMVQEIRKVRPGIPVLFMTAYSHKAVAVNETKFPLINKPFFSEDLIRTVIEILDSPKEASGNSADRCFCGQESMWKAANRYFDCCRKAGVITLNLERKKELRQNEQTKEKLGAPQVEDV